jgi:hypothetical protein
VPGVLLVETLTCVQAQATAHQSAIVPSWSGLRVVRQVQAVQAVQAGNRQAVFLLVLAALLGQATCDALAATEQAGLALAAPEEEVQQDRRVLGEVEDLQIEMKEEVEVAMAGGAMVAAQTQQEVVCSAAVVLEVITIKVVVADRTVTAVRAVQVVTAEEVEEETMMYPALVGELVAMVRTLLLVLEAEAEVEMAVAMAVAVAAMVVAEAGHQGPEERV